MNSVNAVFNVCYPVLVVNFENVLKYNGTRFYLLGNIKLIILIIYR
jgi:hypothetical protein